jgi:hypothetical protein
MSILISNANDARPIFEHVHETVSKKQREMQPDLCSNSLSVKSGRTYRQTDKQTDRQTDFIQR